MENNQSGGDSLISLIEVADDENGNESLISLIEVGDDEENTSDDSISLVESESEYENTSRANEVKLNNIQRAVRSWRHCLACAETKKLHRPSKSMRLYFSKAKKIYIEKNDRVCDFHLQRQNWGNIHCKTVSNFSRKIVDEMVLFLLDHSANECPAQRIDIGLTDAQFRQVLSELGVCGNSNKAIKKTTNAVRLYLERLRLAHTYKQMGFRHNMNRIAVGKMVKLGRNILLQRFVPNHLGYENRSHQWLIDHTTDLAFMLYCNNDRTKCVTIWDATYIYTCSSSNYTHQRKIFSGQKRRHLFKIMKVTAVDGSIIDVFGPFKATTNDSDILKNIFERTSIENIFNAGDVVLVDRGFRDSETFLKNKGFDVRMPEFVQRGTNGQLTTKQCNKSRHITKMRYAIEVANGRMKSKWHLFSKIIPSILTKNLMSDYKIGSALLNAFGKPIICDKNDFMNVGAQMMNRLDCKNELQKIIHSEAFKRTERLFLQPIQSKQLKFPRLNQAQLKLFSLGTYASRQAISYAAEHQKDHGGEFEMLTLASGHVWAHFGQICVKENIDEPMFISTKIKSRFKGQKMHKVYVLYESLEREESKIFHLCSCQHGLRTVGCCSHVMAVVWFFGCGRHEKNNKDPASHHNDFFNTFN